MRLLLLHPEVATRDCGHCQKFLYNPDGTLATYGGAAQIPCQRGPKQLPACRLEIGCPKGTPEQQRSLNLVNVQAYIHYQECRAVGKFPDDVIVRQNARIIRAVEDECERAANERTQLVIQALLKRG